MNNKRQIRKDHHFIVAVLSILIFSSMTVVNGFTNTVNGQTNATQTNSTNNITGLVNTQDITLEKVQVGDIDMAHKMFGKGDPILLIQGVGGSMDAWEPAILRDLSSNHTVIIFDSRGVGNTTTGTKQFSIQQFANDSAGLLDALKIQKANVLGYSMGSFIAQQFVLTHPEKVDRLVLIASTCGGKDNVPNSPEVLELAKKLLSSVVNNTSIEPQEVKAAVALSYGPTWIKLHPDILESIPTNAKDLLLSGMGPDTYIQQEKITQNWKSTNWSGVCSQLPNIAKPTLVITGTEDVTIPAANSLIIAEKIPGAWLVQIRDAGHQITSQYPDEIGKILNTFLSTTSPNN
ncbi:MAG: alpha/beta hydrolase [Candidatus Nitrosocosmicus sp.]|nr:alpha/beta hydrolase [Candidatus Nitrosocosmicus sp.]